jgi:hypothetical protein
MSYDPASTLDILVPAVAAAFAAKVLSAGVAAVDPIEGTRVPRQLPAAQLVQTQITGSHEDETGPIGLTEWRISWRVDLYFQLKDYEAAYAELGAVVPRILHLPVQERAGDGEILPDAAGSGTCDWWVIVDAGDDPNPGDDRELLVKKLVLQAVLTTRP